MAKMIADILNDMNEDKPTVLTVELYREEDEKFPRLKISCNGASVQRYVVHTSEDVGAYIQQYIDENM